jgi:hypothetical protein
MSLASRSEDNNNIGIVVKSVAVMLISYAKTTRAVQEAVHYIFLIE